MEKNSFFAQIKPHIPIRRVLGLSYAALEVKEAALLLALLAQWREGVTVFTPGATVAAQAHRTDALGSLLCSASLLLPDGVGCLLASRLAGEPLRRRAAGIDTAAALLPYADGGGWRVFLYGGREGVAEAAAARIGARYRGITLAVADGYGEDPYERILSFDPHLLFVCLGFPRQEQWIVTHPMPATVSIGLGGSLDVWSGCVARAPRPLRALGLEWLWRTLREPHRIARLGPLPAYFAACLAEGGRRVWQNSQKKRKKAFPMGRI